MKLSFHIGMGKTGTSAIQTSLARSRDLLRQHGMHYLGMWWSFLDPGLDGPEGIEAAAGLRGDAMGSFADSLVAHMNEVSDRESVDHFIFSNEALYGHTHSYEELYSNLLTRVDLEFVVFVREPRQWLSSAYAQWAIRHKTRPGAVQPFAEWAASTIGIYGGLRYWHEKFGSRLAVRKLERGQDVVAEFMKAIGAGLTIPSELVYATPEPALLLLQALYNGAFDDPVLPTSFLEDVYDGEGPTDPVSVEHMIEHHLDHRVAGEVVLSQRELFEDIERTLGIDLLQQGVELAEPPAPDELRARLIDYLIAITLRQARRIATLEERIASLERDTAGPA